MVKNLFASCFIFIISVVFLFSGCATIKKDTPDYYFQKAKENLKNKNYSGAISYLEKAEKKDLKKNLTPEIFLLSGETYFKKSIEYRDSIIMFDDETKSIYLSYLKNARHYFEKLIEKFPKSELADDAQFNIGVIFDWDELGGVNDFEQALVEYQKVIDNHPGSSAYPKAKARIELINSFYGGIRSTPHDIKKP
ncbi:MAG: tetratricopeptide repeat protein [bacterium]